MASSATACDGIGGQRRFIWQCQGLAVNVTVLRAREAINYRLSSGRPLQPVADTAEDLNRVAALFRNDHRIVGEPFQRLI